MWFSTHDTQMEHPELLIKYKTTGFHFVTVDLIENDTWLYSIIKKYNLQYQLTINPILHRDALEHGRCYLVNVDGNVSSIKITSYKDIVRFLKLESK